MKRDWERKKKNKQEKKGLLELNTQLFWWCFPTIPLGISDIKAHRNTHGMEDQRGTGAPNTCTTSSTNPSSSCTLYSRAVCGFQISWWSTNAAELSPHITLSPSLPVSVTPNFNSCTPTLGCHWRCIPCGTFSCLCLLLQVFSLAMKI